MTARFPYPSTLEDICQRVAGKIIRGSPQQVVSSLASLSAANASDLSFIAFANNKASALSSKAGAVLSSAALADNCQSTRIAD